MPAGDFQQCGRGIFGLRDWEPLRKPGEGPRCPTSQQNNSHVAKQSARTMTSVGKMGMRSPPRDVQLSGTEHSQSPPRHLQERVDTKAVRPSYFQHNTECISPVQSNQTGRGKRSEAENPAPKSSKDYVQKHERAQATADSGSGAGGPKPGNRLMAKYNFRPNLNSPLGVELDLVPGQKLTFVGFHDCNWWLAENDQSQQGFIPAEYVMVLEDKITSLPWLHKRETDAAPPTVNNSKFGVPPKDTWKVGKPYNPTYQHKELEKPSEKKYYCDVCEKNFNGPQPYSAHMNSRGHREEVECQEQYAS